MIHIACNIDSNFTKHCAVTLVSIFENNRTEKFFIHIVSPGLPADDQRKLKEMTDRYHHSIRFYFPGEEILSAFSIREFGKRISMSTYYRCMLSAILPADIKKCLYLDCDIVIMGSIAEFWNTDISGKAAACVKDIGSDDPSRYKQLAYPPQDAYFNAGVLLINLEYWRQHRMDEQCVTYFQTYPERIRFNDQDLLNALLHDKKVFVPLKWNMQDGFYRYNMDTKMPDPKKYREELLHPAILHYTNKKPWNYDSLHPLRGEYYKYLAMTPWKGEHPLSTFQARFKRFLKMLPYALRLRKPKYMKF